MTSPRLIPQEPVVSAELVPMVESDLSAVAGFVAAQSAREREIVDAHLRWFLLENPARTPEQPLGFVLLAAGDLVGCILCIPQFFQFKTQRILMMGSSSFYVDERHRGHGGRIFLGYSRLGARWPLFGTSANPVSAALWKAAGAKQIPNSDGELFGILRWPPVAEELAYRRTANPFISRLLKGRISNTAALFRRLKTDSVDADSLQQLDCVEQVNDIMRRHLHLAEHLTALRDPAYIRWRYFSGRDTTVALFAYRSRIGQDILVTVNQRTRGYRNQINTLNVLDVYPEIPASEGLRIVSALISRYSNAVDAIVLRNQDQERRDLFSKRGFQWRAFDAPIGWVLDREKLLPADNWHFVSADGDGLI
jgi:hypothetical protein